MVMRLFFPIAFLFGVKLLGCPNLLDFQNPTGLKQFIPVVPAPRQVDMLEGYFNLNQLGAFNDKLLSANLLDFQNPTGLKHPHFNCGLPATDPAFARLANAKNILPDGLGNEGYQLLIEPERIWLTANTPAGLFYGVQSLKQLVRAEANLLDFQNLTGLEPIKIPCLKITDFPAFPYRAIMDDISRGPLPNMDFLKKQIVRMAGLKINLLTYYTEHVVKTDKHPAFSPLQGITLGEFKELSAFAEQYNVRLIGNFQSLGHANKVLASPKYAHLGATHRMFKPGDPETLRFLTEVYDEMLPSFSADFFNINADEAWDLSRLAQTKGQPGQAYASHVVPLLQHLIEAGKKPMLWGDMALAYPEVFDFLPKEATVLAWNYDALEDFSEYIDPLKNRGIDFWICPGILNSNRTFPDFLQAYINIQNFANQGYKAGASGIMTCVWDDGGRHFFAKDWYGVAMAAEQSWHPNDEPKNDFDRRFSKTFFSDEKMLLPTFFKQVIELADLYPTQKMNTHFFAMELLPEPGDSIVWSTKDWEAVARRVGESDLVLQQLPAYADWSDDRLLLAETLSDYQKILLARQAILKIKSWYEQAIVHQKTDPDEVGIYLRWALEEAASLWEDWAFVYPKEFTTDWLSENRTYWLQEATSVYRKKGDDFAALKNRLESATENFAPELGQYLPTLKEVGLDIRLTDRPYFTFWLLSPVFPLGKGQSLHTDFLLEMGGELAARPTPYDWQKHQSLLADRVGLTALSEKKEKMIVYAYATIESTEDQLVSATTESSGGITVILNGEYVPNGLSLSNLELPLQSGKNHLILKYVNGVDDPWFSFRLDEVKICNRKHKYQIGCVLCK